MPNENNNRTAVSSPNVEFPARDEPLSKSGLPTFYTPVNIHIKSYRKRTHDTDGVSVKAVLDGLVKLGILEGDSCKEVKKVSFESEISKTEKTIIEIEDML